MAKKILVVEDNKINILDGRNILFDDVTFAVPHGEILTNIKGDKSQNIFIQNGESRTECSMEKPIKVEKLSQALPKSRK